MRIEQVIKTNMHFIIPVLVVAGFGLAYNLLGGAAALLYVAGVIGAVYHFSQPEQTKISVESATSYADELIAEEQAQLAAEAASSSKKVRRVACAEIAATALSVCPALTRRRTRRRGPRRAPPSPRSSRLLRTPSTPPVQRTRTMMMTTSCIWLPSKATP